MERKLLEIENARIIFRNFEGRETLYNREGDKNFCVVIEDPEVAQSLADHGWNVKTLAPRDESEEPTYYIQVAVRFNKIPPVINMYTSTGGVQLDEETVSTLDFADIQNVDLVINPRVWDDNGTQRIKAYLKTMYVTIEEDRFAAKYAAMEHPEE